MLGELLCVLGEQCERGQNAEELFVEYRVYFCNGTSQFRKPAAISVQDRRHITR